MRPIQLILTLFIFFAGYSCESYDNDRSEGNEIESAQADTTISLKDTSFISVDTNSDLQLILKSLAAELKSGDKLKIRNISSEKGFTSILEWSDSLKDKSFIAKLARDLVEYKGDEKLKIDSKLTIPLGEPDDILGATGGYVVLINIKNRVVIDEFLGAK